MRFETYFVLKQEVLLRRFATAKQGARIESCRAMLVARDHAIFELKLLCSDQEAKFSPGEFLELHTDRFELGVRLTGICLDCTDRKLRFEAHDDLELYYRRQFWRMTIPVWHGMLRTGESKQPLYEVWEKAQDLSDEKNLDPSIHVEIVRSPLNISAGGVRMELQSPVKVKEDCLLYLCLDDGKPTVCALCEIVWVEKGESDQTRLCGLRFSNLIETDLKRIDRYVTQNCKFDPSGTGAPIEKTHSV